MRFTTRAASRTVAPVFTFVGAIRVHAFRNRVAMDAERGGGVSDALLVTRVGFLNIEFLEFLERLVEQYVPVKHIFNYSFEAGANLHSLSDSQSVGVFALRTIQSAVKPAHSKKSELLARDQFVSFQVTGGRGARNLGRQFGTWWLLVPFNALQVIAHILLVKRWLRLANLIAVDWPEA